MNKRSSYDRVWWIHWKSLLVASPELGSLFGCVMVAFELVLASVLALMLVGVGGFMLWKSICGWISEQRITCSVLVFGSLVCLAGGLTLSLLIAKSLVMIDSRFGWSRNLSYQFHDWRGKRKTLRRERKNGVVSIH